MGGLLKALLLAAKAYKSGGGKVLSAIGSKVKNVSNKAANSSIGNVIGKGLSKYNDSELAKLATDIGIDRGLDWYLDDDNPYKDLLVTAARANAIRHGVRLGNKASVIRNNTSQLPVGADVIKDALIKGDKEFFVGSLPTLLGIGAAKLQQANASERVKNYVQSPNSVASSGFLLDHPMSNDEIMQERIRQAISQGKRLYDNKIGRNIANQLSGIGGEILPVLRDRDKKGEILEDDSDEQKWLQLMYGLSDPNNPRFLEDVDYDFNNITKDQAEMMDYVMNNLSDEQYYKLGKTLQETQPERYKQLTQYRPW